MGEQERSNIARYEATKRLLDRGSELTSILWKRSLPSHAEGIRQRLGWLVLALADGRLRQTEVHAELLEEAVRAAGRRVGMRREVLSTLEALHLLGPLLRPPPPCGWSGSREPVQTAGDWTTAAVPKAQVGLPLESA